MRMDIFTSPGARLQHFARCLSQLLIAGCAGCLCWPFMAHGSWLLDELVHNKADQHEVQSRERCVSCHWEALLQAFPDTSIPFSPRTPRPLDAVCWPPSTALVLAAMPTTADFRGRHTCLLHRSGEAQTRTSCDEMCDSTGYSVCIWRRLRTVAQASTMVVLYHCKRGDEDRDDSVRCSTGSCHNGSH